jgi:hypothetical protein
MNGLHTVFCHKCGKAMTYPYEQDNELYHRECLPTLFADEEYEKYLDEKVYNSGSNEINS